MKHLRRVWVSELFDKSEIFLFHFSSKIFLAGLKSIYWLFPLLNYLFILKIFFCKSAHIQNEKMNIFFFTTMD